MAASRGGERRREKKKGAESVPPTLHTSRGRRSGRESSSAMKLSSSRAEKRK
jgi:hypothetical protein